jgi:glycerophosphoryl diester phosphodiesterase
MGNSIKIFAHRGASGHAFENSFKAFDKAIHQKADGIEMDLQCSKDGQLFVFHDVNFKRLAGINAFVYNSLAEEIAEYRLGRRFLRRFSKLRIPKIEEFMEWVEINPVPLNIELKESLLKYPEVLITWLIDVELPEGSHFSSFFPELLQIVKQVRPEMETAILVTKLFKWEELKHLDYVDAVHASKKYYKRLYLTTCAEANRPMRFYGITGEEDFIKNPHPIVVGWITDYPKKVAQAIAKK